MISNSCKATGSPCLTINGAIGKATDGETLKVATGTYTDSGTEVVLINKSMTLYGGWDASFTAQNGMSTVDGQSARQGIVINSGTTVVIDHFTVQNGFSSGDGGGIYIEGEPTLNNSTVKGNSASQYGGGISSRGSGALTISNSTISGNRAGGGGGVMASGGTLMTLNNSSVINNYSTADGAGILVSQNLVLINSAIKDNISSETGGGIFIYGTHSLTLNNTTVTGNQAVNGGGINLYNYSGSYPQETTILNSTVSNNTAQTGGGINMEHSSPARIVTVRNSIIANNIAPTAADCSGSIGTSDHNIIGNTSNCSVTPGREINLIPIP